MDDVQVAALHKTWEMAESAGIPLEKRPRVIHREPTHDNLKLLDQELADEMGIPRYEEYVGMTYEQASREADRLMTVQGGGWFRNYGRMGRLRQIMVTEMKTGRAAPPLN